MAGGGALIFEIVPLSCFFGLVFSLRVFRFSPLRLLTLVSPWFGVVMGLLLCFSTFNLRVTIADGNDCRVCR